MRLFLNGLAASAGAGLTYLYNIVPHLSATPGICVILAVQPGLRRQFESFANVEVFAPEGISGAARRFWFEQTRLPAIIRSSGADLLISAGNFAMRSSPVPQILLSGNSLYTSSEFSRDLRARREFLKWLENTLKGSIARRSVLWADITVAPTRAFAGELQRWTGKKVIGIHHGFDNQIFFDQRAALPQAIKEKIHRSAQNCVRLLFVSHYNYYRNFETLLRALPIIREHCNGKPVKLLLTCTLERGQNPGSYNPRFAAKLIEDLQLQENVVELGAVPYNCLHQLYRACDLYVTAAYAETFAHPVVEAMASGLPIVASGIAAHREVCGDAALYFDPFDSRGLARRISQALTPETRSQLLLAGEKRIRDFSWANHATALLEAAAVCRARTNNETCISAQQKSLVDRSSESLQT
jgi:glycosyltransferase involved in cell wall biosynthesis